MNNTTDSEPPRRPLLDLTLPEKLSVKTSRGTLYARYARLSDLKQLENPDEHMCGKAVVRVLTSRVADADDDTPLADEDIEALTEADFAALAPALAKQNEWGEIPEGPILEVLGRLFKQDLERQLDRQKKALDGIRESIGKSYAFLGKNTLAKLNEQVGSIAALRGGFPVGALEVLKRSGASFDALNPLSKTLDPMKIDDAARPTGSEFFSRKPKADADQSNAYQLKNPEFFSGPPLRLPPALAETPVGRAAIENARHTREVALKMDALTGKVADLFLLLTQEVFPAWFKQVKDGSRFAMFGIGLALASTFCSIATSYWQVSVERGIDHENTLQQKRVEELLREQIAIQNKLIAQQENDAEQLRSLLQQQTKREEQLLKLANPVQKAPTSTK